ncbi:hypothetical protein BV20DRAFT_910803, partial [Pilatotrama ljubarskyi]
LRIVSQNVNHTPAQSHLLLESLVRECDILFIQEPYYCPIKTVTSNTDPAEETLVGTQVHPAWLLMETCTRARVCAYVNCELLHLRLQLCSHIVEHRDMILILITVDRTVHYLLNVYNDDRGTALSWLEEHQDGLPPLDLVVGDFNLHSTVWEPDLPHDSPRAVGLLNLMAGLGLVNDGRQPTHRPHDGRLRCTVPDLLWAPSDKVAAGEIRAKIDLEGRGYSDHALLSTSLHIGWWEQQLPPTIWRKSDAEKAFLKDLTTSVAKIEVDATNVHSIQRTCDAILAAVKAAWDAHAVAPRITSRSKRWWNEQCRSTMAALRVNRTRENRQACKRAQRLARQEYYEERIAEACEKGR